MTETAGARSLRSTRGAAATPHASLDAMADPVFHRTGTAHPQALFFYPKHAGLGEEHHGATVGRAGHRIFLNGRFRLQKTVSGFWRRW